MRMYSKQLYELNSIRSHSSKLIAFGRARDRLEPPSCSWQVGTSELRPSSEVPTCAEPCTGSGSKPPQAGYTGTTTGATVYGLTSGIQPLQVRIRIIEVEVAPHLAYISHRSHRGLKQVKDRGLRRHLILNLAMPTTWRRQSHRPRPPQLQSHRRRLQPDGRQGQSRTAEGQSKSAPANRTLRRWIRTDQLSSILRTRWSTGGCRLTSMFCLDLLTNTRLSGANCMASVSDSEGGNAHTG